MERLERKYDIQAISRESGVRHDHNDSVLFLAQDKAFLAILPVYRAKCAELGSNDDHLKEIDLLIERIENFQKKNPHRVKVPDSKIIKF